MQSYPLYPKRRVHVLDGVWDFSFLGENVALEHLDAAAVHCPERTAVPGCFDAFPATAGKRGTAVYRTVVEVTPGTAGLLTFGGLGMWARVLVDGTVRREVALPYTAFEVPVPPSDRLQREVRVVVDNRFDRQRLPLLEQFFDFYCYGGIYRSVAWHELPAGPRLDRAAIRVLDAAAGTVMVTTSFLPPSPETVDLAVEIDGCTVRSLRGIEVEDGKVQVSLEVPDPTPWSPAHPRLHVCTVHCGGDAVSERFGLRTVGVVDGKVAINGEPVKLLGYCRHEAHPQYGPALPLAQLVQDLQLLRDLGCNAVRGSHYPQDQRFLDLCDEMGFLVFEESLGWGQKAEHFTDPAFAAGQLEQTAAMVRKSINHPAVVLWGFLNEGASNKPESRSLYASLASLIRAQDPSRLVTFATMHPFDDINLDLVDVISVNTYPGWYAQDQNKVAPAGEIVPRLAAIHAAMAAKGFAGKPLLISEIGAGAIYGWRDALEAHWSEEYQERYLETVCREIVDNPAFAGVMLWQFCDCRTYASAMALRRPRAFNNKGTLDEFRRPKMAYRTVRRIFADDRSAG